MKDFGIRSLSCALKKVRMLVARGCFATVCCPVLYMFFDIFEGLNVSFTNAFVYYL